MSRQKSTSSLLKKIALACATAALLLTALPLANVSAQENELDPADPWEEIDGGSLDGITREEDETELWEEIDGGSLDGISRETGEEEEPSVTVDELFASSVTSSSPSLNLYPSVKDRYEGDAYALLPAFRWHGDANLYSECNRTGGFISSKLDKFACGSVNLFLNILMGAASWTWSISLNMFRLALSVSDALTDGLANYVFNPIFMAVYETGLASVFWPIAIFVIFTAFLAGVKSKKGGRNSTIRLLLVGLLPLVLLQVAGNSVNKEIAGGQGVDRVAGSPLWISEKATGFIDSITGTITTSMLRNIGSLQSGGTTSSLNCSNYVSTLEGFYLDAGGNSVMVPISRFWQGAFLPAFFDAQYGLGTDRSRESIYCHQMEAANGTERHIQAAIGVAAGYPKAKWNPAIEGEDSKALPKKLSETTLANDYVTENEGCILKNLPVNHTGTALPGFLEGTCSKTDDHAWFFQNGGRRDPYLAGMDTAFTLPALMMWDACSYSSSDEKWRVQAAYMSPQMGDYRVFASDCALWWETGMPARYTDEPTEIEYTVNGNKVKLNAHGFDWGAQAPGDGAQDPHASDPSKDRLNTSIPEIRQLHQGLTGRQQGNAYTAIFLALITGILYLAVFAGLSIVVFMSSIAATILWACFPITLMFIAIDAVKGGGGEGASQGPGMKMLRMTGGYTFMATITSVFLTVALVMTTLIGEALRNVFRSFDTLGMFLQGLAPLLVFFILRKLAKKAGLSGMMTPRGAMSMGAFGGAAVAGMNTSTNKEGERKSVKGLGNQFRNLGKQMRNGDKFAARQLGRAALAKDGKGGFSARKGAKALVGGLKDKKSARSEVKAGLFGTESAIVADDRKKREKLAQFAASKLDSGIQFAGQAVTNPKALALAKRDAVLERLRSSDDLSAVVWRAATQTEKNLRHQSTPLSTERQRLLAASNGAKRKRIASLEDMLLSEDLSSERREEIARELSEARTDYYSPTTNTAQAWGVTDSDGKPFLTEDEKFFIAAATNTNTGEPLTPEELKVHIENHGFESDVSGGVVLKLAPVDSELPVEYRAEYAASLAKVAEIPANQITVSSSGLLVPDLSGNTAKGLLELQTGNSVFAPQALSCGILSEGARAALDHYPKEVQADIIARVMVDYDILNETGQVGDILSVMSGGRITVDSPQVTVALEELAKGNVTSELIEIQRLSPQAGDFEAAYKSLLDEGFVPKSVQDSARRSFAEVAISVRDSSPSFSTTEAKIDKLRTEINTLIAAPQGSVPTDSINKVAGQLNEVLTQVDSVKEGIVMATMASSSVDPTNRDERESKLKEVEETIEDLVKRVGDASQGLYDTSADSQATFTTIQKVLNELDEETAKLNNLQGSPSLVKRAKGFVKPEDGSPQSDS